MRRLLLKLKPYRFHFLLFTFYFLLSFVFTYPVILKMSQSIYGYPGDSFGFIYYLWWWKYTLLKGLPLRDAFLQEAPFGLTLDPESGSVFFLWPAKILTLILDEIFAYNFLLILSFPLSAMAMYILTFSVTKNRWASFFSGLVFSFCPYHFWKAYNHLDLTMIWGLPLYVWAMTRIDADGNADQRRFKILKDAALAAFFFAATALTNLYYGYFLALFTAAFIIIRTVQEWLANKTFYLTKRLLTSYFLLLTFSLSIILPFLFPVLKDALSSKKTTSRARQESYQRPLLNLVSLSARPWDYFIPSKDHPIFGRFVPLIYEKIRPLSEDFKTISTFPHERTIYLGFTPILLSLVALYFYLKSRRLKEVPIFYFLIFIFILTSMPPYIFLKGKKFLFPSFFLYKVFPMFRSYVRLGILVELCVALLAGIGLTALFNKVKNKKLHISYLILPTFLLLFEFLNFPPFHVTDFSKIPPEYLWLAKQPGDFIIIEYPRMFNVAEGLFFQRIHQKRLFNPHDLSPHYKEWEKIKNIYDPSTPKNLASLEIKYALVHKKLIFEEPNPVDDLWYTRALQEPLDLERIPKGLKLVKDFPKTAIFVVE